MYLSKVLSLLIVGLMTCPAQAAALSSPAQATPQNDRAERERQRNADRAAKRAAEQTKEYQETMKEVAGELEELGATLLQERYRDPFLQDFVNELGQSLVPKKT